MLKIGSVALPGRVIMAPLAGAGGHVFRRVAREHGAGMVVTPLISAEGIVRGDPKSMEAASVGPHEQPCAVQLFGHDPSVMARAARTVESMGATLIDINAGCPSTRIMACKAGAHLMGDPDHLLRVVAAVADAVCVPVTVKTRLGLRPHEVGVIPVVHAAARAGAAAITIHARFRGDSPAAPARWEWIRAAVQETDMPVIGNGGIHRPADAARMVETTGCAGVMIGRAAVGRPWLLRQCGQAMAGEAPDPDPPVGARVLVALHHVALQEERDPRGREVRATAGVVSAYLRGMDQARLVRPSIVAARTYAELTRILRELIPGAARDLSCMEEST